MKLKNIAIYALVTGGLSLPVMTSGIALSHAAQGSVEGGHLVTFKHDAPSGAWKATQVSAEKSKHPYCSVEAGFKNAGATIVLARNKKGLNSLAIDFGRQLFEKGREYDIRIATDIGLERKYSARALTPTLLMAQVGRDKPFMRAISYNGDFTFHVPQTVRATLTLAGADDALDRLGKCLTTLEEFIPPLADDTYLREARAKAVKKRRSGDSTLVEESGPSRTAKSRIAKRAAPKNVPVPTRKADMMNIKVTRVDAPVVYEPKVSEEDSIAQPDMVEIARKEISSKIDELAQQGDVKAGEAEERVAYSEKRVTPERQTNETPQPEQVAEDMSEDTPVKQEDTQLAASDKTTRPVTPAAEKPATDKPAAAKTAPADAVAQADPAIAVKKSPDGQEVVADVSVPADEAEPMDVIQDIAAATPPSNDGLMSPMPGATGTNAAQTGVAGNDDIIVSVTQPRDTADQGMADKSVVWKSDRAEIRDPAARNIMALEKRTKTTAPEQPVKAAAAAPSLLPAPDLPADMPEQGAYFPEQMAELPEATIKDAIKVEIAAPVTEPAKASATATEEPAAPQNGTQLASLQAVSGPFDAAEYERLKQLAQKKHAQEKQAQDKQAQDKQAIHAAAAADAQPVSLTVGDEANVADIITAAGDDAQTSSMKSASMTATGAPTDLSFKTTGSLSRADYQALKARTGAATAMESPAVEKQAPAKQTSLSDAVAQMIPARYQITVGNGVDMNRTVSWQDGENWQDAIARTLSPIGVEAQVNGSVVMLMTMAQ